MMISKQLIALTYFIQLISEIVNILDNLTIYLYTNYSFYCRPQVVKTIIPEDIQLSL